MVQAVVREIVAHGSTAVKVDGPYGEPTEVEAKADTPVLLVAGGVGVSPHQLHVYCSHCHAYCSDCYSVDHAHLS